MLVHHIVFWFYFVSFFQQLWSDALPKSAGHHGIIFSRLHPQKFTQELWDEAGEKTAHLYVDMRPVSSGFQYYGRYIVEETGIVDKGEFNKMSTRIQNKWVSEFKKTEWGLKVMLQQELNNLEEKVLPGSARWKEIRERLQLLDEDGIRAKIVNGELHLTYTKLQFKEFDRVLYDKLKVVKQADIRGKRRQKKGGGKVGSVVQVQNEESDRDEGGLDAGVSGSSGVQMEEADSDC